LNNNLLVQCENPFSLTSHTVDANTATCSVFLVCCGSNVHYSSTGFMENCQYLQASQYNNN
jgi:hypothetical protein